MSVLIRKNIVAGGVNITALTGGRDIDKENFSAKLKNRADL
jgi:hypothetical protein